VNGCNDEKVPLEVDKVALAAEAEPALVMKYST